MPKDIIDDVIEFWEKIRSVEEVIIKFIKKDGTIRIMNCTLDFKRIPRADKPKNINIPKILKLVKKAKIVHVYDLEKRGWRSIPFNNVDWLQTPDRTRYSIKK